MFLVKIKGIYIKTFRRRIDKIRLTDKKRMAYRFSDREYIKEILDNRGFKNYEIEELDA